MVPIPGSVHLQLVACIVPVQLFLEYLLNILLITVKPDPLLDCWGGVIDSKSVATRQKLNQVDAACVVLANQRVQEGTPDCNVSWILHERTA